MMYYRISKNEKILFFGKKIAQVWAVTLMSISFIGNRSLVLILCDEGAGLVANDVFL